MNSPKFEKYYIDKLVTTWERTSVCIRANSIKEADKIAESAVEGFSFDNCNCLKLDSTIMEDTKMYTGCYEIYRVNSNKDYQLIKKVE